MKLVVYSGSITDEKIKRVVNTARYKRMVAHYESELGKYARFKLDQELHNRTTDAPSIPTDRPSTGSQSATINVKADEQNAYLTTDVSTSICVAPRQNDDLDAKFRELNQVKCELGVGELEILKANIATTLKPLLTAIEKDGSSDDSIQTDILAQIKPSYDEPESIFSTIGDYALTRSSSFNDFARRGPDETF